MAILSVSVSGMAAGLMFDVGHRGGGGRLVGADAAVVGAVAGGGVGKTIGGEVVLAGSSLPRSFFHDCHSTNAIAISASILA